MTEALSTLPDLRSLVEQLAECRSDADFVDELWRDVQREMEGENAHLLSERKRLHEALTSLEAEVRMAAVANFYATGDKQPGPGVEIALTDELVVDDELAALAWCTLHAPYFLTQKLDTVAIKSHVKQRRPLAVPGVHMERVPKPRIATRLGAALDAPEIRELNEGKAS